MDKKDLKKSIDSFLNGEAKVAVIKGDWGVGKTYFWEKYIESRINQKELNQIAYSYISLFGQTSLDSLRKSIFHNIKGILDEKKIEEAFDKKFKESSKLLSKVPWLSKSIVAAQKNASIWKNTKSIIQSLPNIGNFASIISELEYSFVHDYLICFDDMERKGRLLSVIEIMGLIDELAHQKNCKIILIFNKGQLDRKRDRDEYEKYREKIVDLEINLNPNSKVNLRHVFREEMPHFDFIEKIIKKLSIKNIRILKKIKWLIDESKLDFNEHDDGIVQPFFLNAIVLSYFYYNKNEKLPYAKLKKYLSGGPVLYSMMSHDPDRESLSPAEEEYKYLELELKISESEFDESICFYLENGYFESDSINRAITKLTSNHRMYEVAEEIQSVFSMYSDSFSDNLEEFIVKLKELLNNHLELIRLSDFTTMIGFLEDFDKDVSEYIDKYIEFHSVQLLDEDYFAYMHYTIIINGRIKSKIDNLRDKQNISALDVDSCAFEVAEKGWDTHCIDYLSSLTVDDFFQWMKSSPPYLMEKVRGLTKLKTIQGIDEDKTKQNKIATNIEAALKLIASENDFNKVRVKNIFTIDIDS